ncbi:HNH endonuclease [Streptomyces aureus]|uniref:HNH endonuclease n=1 Tax=Streptomyces aureus TaxID=193461 RepID=UPI0005646E08|nr:HNH endonuclease signature motif containing protein [Streptomyces aureus]
MTTRPIRTNRMLCGRQRRSKKRTLYAAQDGRCATCATALEPAALILKNKIHRKAGGTNTLANLHLICHHCNTHGTRKSGSAS